MAWYGVNFLIRGGLHSYGHGAGGELYVGAFVLANLLLVALAAARYWTEKNTVVAQKEPSGGTQE